MFSPNKFVEKQDYEFAEGLSNALDNLDEKLETTIELIKNLIGEYSLTYVTDSHIVFAVDQWGTKNLFFYYDQSTRMFLIASTVDCVLPYAPNAVRVQGNRIYTIDKHTFELDIIETTEWNFAQTTTNYDDVFETFESSEASKWASTMMYLKLLNKQLRIDMNQT